MRQQGRRAGAASPVRPAFQWPWAWQPRFGAALAAVVVVVLLATMTFTAVAGQPGQSGYGLRVAVERLPVLLSPSAEGRVTAELRLADRRLADAEAYFLEAGNAAAPALDALLASDAMAASQADVLGETERAEVQARIATHARLLAGLSETAADGQVAESFERAAMVANQIALQLAAGAKGPTEQHGPQEPRSNDPVTGPTQLPAGRSTPGGGATDAPRQPTVTPEAPATAATTPAVTALAPGTNMGATPMRRWGPGADMTDMPGRSTAVPPATPASTNTPVPQATPQGPGGVTPTPGQRATEHVETATPPGPQGTPSDEGPGPQGTPPGTGPGPQGPSDGGTPGQPPGTPEATAVPAPPAGTPDSNPAPPGHAGGSLPADGPAATPGHP